MKLYLSVATAFALSSSAYASSSIRGSPTLYEEQQHQRSLQRNDLNRNEMQCGPHQSGDIVCSYRIDAVNMAQTGQGTTVHSCPYISSLNSNMCMTANVNPTNLANIPAGYWNSIGRDSPGSSSSSSSGGSSSSSGGSSSGGSMGQDMQDQPPAEYGDYQQGSYALNPDGMCISNGVGASCSNPSMPSIACCTSDATGAFFNACCVSGFNGISMGGQDPNGKRLNGNEFDIIIGGAGADCVANTNQQGCEVLNVPGNEPNTPIDTSGIPTPCTRKTGSMCPSGTVNEGTCTQSGGSRFDVCCSNRCSTGTYQAGESCAVTIDAASCGYDTSNLGGGMSSGGGSTSSGGGSFGGGMSSGGSTSSGGSFGGGSFGGGFDNGMRPSGQSGSVGTGGTCSSSNDCIQSTFCASNRKCVSMGSCQMTSDCEDSNNMYAMNSCPGTIKCYGVTCQKTCNASNPNQSIGNNGCPGPFTNTCPSSQPQNRQNCCSSLPQAPGVAVEKSCMYGSVQCRCGGQLNDAGTSDAVSIGWDCRDLSPGPNNSVDLGPAN